MNDESMRERFEAWLKSRNGDPMFWNTSDAMFAAWQAATLAERERAAKVCEKLDAFDMDDPGSTAAAAIRKGE